jgi:hypothetical protein
MPTVSSPAAPDKGPRGFCCLQALPSARMEPIELYLGWTEDAWVLWTSRGKLGTKQVVDCLPAATGMEPSSPSSLRSLAVVVVPKAYLPAVSVNPVAGSVTIGTIPALLVFDPHSSMSLVAGGRAAVE